MKVYGERTAFAETSMIALDLSRTETMALSDLGHVKRTGIEERFGRRYHVELKMGWGTGDHQLYHLGYLGRRTISEGSMLYYGCGAGINTSRIWPDSARHRYFGVWTQWLRQFTLASRFEYTDYRGPTLLNDLLEWYVLESRGFSLSNRYAYHLSGNYGLEVPVDLDRIEIDGASWGVENSLRIAPRFEADFLSFRSSAGMKFEYSSECLLAEPSISYSKRNPIPDVGFDRMTLSMGYALVDEAGGRQHNFVVSDARLEFFGERMAVDAGCGYRVHDVIREFNENRLMGRRDESGESRVEKEKVHIGIDARIPMWSLDSRLEFKRVEEPFYWDPSMSPPQIFHRRYPSDVSMLSLTVTQDFSYGWIGSRYLMASEEIPYTYRFELWAGMKHRFGPIADLDYRYRFQTLPYRVVGDDDKSIFKLDVGIQREILKLFTARFEVNNIANEKYLVWPGLESGCHFLFSIHMQL